MRLGRPHGALGIELGAVMYKANILPKILIVLFSLILSGQSIVLTRKNSWELELAPSRAWNEVKSFG